MSHIGRARQRLDVTIGSDSSPAAARSFSPFFTKKSDTPCFAGTLPVATPFSSSAEISAAAFSRASPLASSRTVRIPPSAET